MGYTPVFDSVFTGTLCGKWPDTGIWVCLLAMADRHGVIDKTPQYISAVVGIDVDELVSCIDRFLQPDPHSRSGEEDGRRMVRLDEGRAWGWRIVNHGKYRERARKAAYDSERTASGADAERKRMSRDVPARPAPSRSQTPDSDSDKEHTDTRAREPDVVAIADEAEHHVGFERVRKAYPPFAGRQNWVIAEHHCRTRIAHGATWNALLDAVKRYAKFVDSGGVSSTAHVLRPETFFSAADEPWAQAWELPVAKPKTAFKPPPFVAPPDNEEMGARIA